jgi:hypothetical protein
MRVSRVYDRYYLVQLVQLKVVHKDSDNLHTDSLATQLSFINILISLFIHRYA